MIMKTEKQKKAEKTRNEIAENLNKSISKMKKQKREKPNNWTKDNQNQLNKLISIKKRNEETE